MAMKRCGRCREEYPKRDLLQWSDDAGVLSPFYCPDCYDFIVDQYEQGQDMSELLWDDADDDTTN